MPAGGNEGASPVLLFHRRVRQENGSQIKVRDYFAHAQHSRRYVPRVYFTDDSAERPDGLWAGIPREPEWAPQRAAALFVSGVDWEAVPGDNERPVINLIQSLRHARAGHPLRAFLSRPAVRICVSEEVTEAIHATGEVNGPVLTIRNALDTAALPLPRVVRDVDVLVAGLKAPDLAAETVDLLRRAGVAVAALEARLPRAEFLDWIGRSRVVVLLPLPDEGFFLPPLEAMALRSVVVCPDSIGNRGHCRDGVTCLVPNWTAADLTAAALAALALPAAEREAMLAAGQREVARHAPAGERAALLDVLDSLATPR